MNDWKKLLSKGNKNEKTNPDPGNYQNPEGYRQKKTMSEFTATNVAAGTTAVTISVGQSMTTAESFYKATWEQVITGDFFFVMSDALGLFSMLLLALNFFWTIRRNKNKG